MKFSPFQFEESLLLKELPLSDPHAQEIRRFGRLWLVVLDSKQQSLVEDELRIILNITFVWFRKIFGKDC